MAATPASTSSHYQSLPDARCVSGTFTARRLDTWAHPLSVIRDVLIEARIVIVAIFSVRVVVASGIIATWTIHKLMMVLGWAAISTSVYLFNGLTDLQTDRANGSTRPLATGQLAERSAWQACIVLCASGLLTVSCIGAVPAFLATSSLLLGWAYSAGPRLKRSASGSLTTIGLGALLSYLAGASVAGAKEHDLVILIVWSAWIGVGAGVKDLSDVVGDRESGRRTLAVLLGTRRSCRLVAIGTGLLCLALIAAASIDHELPFACTITCGTALLALRLGNAYDAATRQRLRAPYRTFMLTQFSANLVYAVTSFM